ncbi:hypothetical protein SASPL_154246 [Salvia splendens]|uniref:Rab3-GAP regulatory subunit N-terminal domain-containing protein n=1 Tax=Salvia splendens TaxID=180675 RepID=A0A8X8W088_SALSN|nr:hypothetical protein SASPL_154246 [Salvia splendens]
MSRRNHTTELGCIAGTDLSAVVAGKPSTSPPLSGVFDDDIRVLAVGTSCGYLMIFSITVIVNPAKILKIRVRGIKQDLTQDTSSEEVCVVMPGVVARFDGSDIKSLLQQWFQESGSQSWDQDFNMFQDDSGKPVRILPYQLWNVSKYGVCADAAVTGVMPWKSR